MSGSLITRALFPRASSLPLLARTMASVPILPSKKFKYVVLGGGVAAGYAARVFVEHGIEKEEVAIVSNDEAPPYERPALSKGFLKPENPARLPGFHTCVAGGGEKQDSMWYVHNGIRFLPRTTITDVDLDKQRLETERGTFVEYDKLIVATGSEAVHLDTLDDKEGEVSYMRRVKDAQVFYDRLSSAPKGTHFLVMAGGYLGMEVSTAVLEFGHKLTMIVPGGKMIKNLFTDKIAEVYQSAFTRRGAQIVDGRVKKVTRNAEGTVNGLELEDGQKLEGDAIFAAVGARPNTELLQDKLKMEEAGFSVDGSLRSSNPNVYVVGDVATFPLILEGGKPARYDHVQNARDSAMHAARAILAADGRCEDPGNYEYLPYFYSRIFDFSWKSYGVYDGDVVHFGEFSEGKCFGAFWIRENRVVGTFLETASDEEHDKIKALAKERPAADNIEGLLKDIFGRPMPLA